MDSSRKPDRKNPRKGVNPISQLFFIWIVPVFWKGTRQGLNAADLTQCLKKDESESLGDELEREWKREMERAQKRNRAPRLRNAMFHMFAPHFVFDGFKCFVFILIRSLLPLVLAQLLIQFQKPIISENAVQNATSSLKNSLADQLNNSLIDRNIRSLLEDDLMKNSVDSHLTKDLFIVPDYPPSGDSNSVSDQFDSIDDVKNESIRNNFPPAMAVSEKNDELRLNFTRAEFYSYFNHIWSDVYWLAHLVVWMVFFSLLLSHHFDLRLQMVGARMRIACCSLIYRKSLRLSALSASRTGSGYLVNLMSNDVSRLDRCIVNFHYIWILPLQSVFIGYLIWQRVKWAAVVGVVGLLLKTVPVQTRLTHYTSALRMKVARRTDNRVGIMNEIINGIQVIKMYAWEIPFQKVVAEARRLEIKQIRYASYIRGVNLSSFVFIERSTLFISIATCILTGQHITADIVFAMAQYFNILQLNAAIFYPYALQFAAEALVSVKRIEEFLLKGEKNEAESGLERRDSVVLLDSKQNAVDLSDVSASWEEESSQKTLKKINLKIRPGQLCAIIGPVGAGKSSMTQLLLGELPVQEGKVIINGSLSYAAQKAWLFSGTVRNNILFGHPYDKNRYNEVVKCCALTTDFEQLPNGDKTVVGERGASLSGGQRARISLARAMYKTASIYILDDPLSAVDAHVGKHLFDEVIGPRGLVKNETRILITHQVHFLKEADVIVIVENGEITHSGTYAELSNSDLDFAKLLQKLEEEEKSDDALDESASLGEGSIYEDDDIPYIDGYVQNGSPYRALKKRTDSMSKSSCGSQEFDNDQIEAEEQAVGNVPWRVFSQYFLAGTNWCGLLMILMVMIFSLCVTSGTDYFVNYWTLQEYKRLNGEQVPLTQMQYLAIYGLLIIGLIFICIYRSILFFRTTSRASKTLHDQMFHSILHAPMRFFDLNPSGRILNRFSKDMGAIDEILPRVMMEAIQIILVMCGILVVVMIVNPPMIVALAVAAVLFTLIIKLYLRPSQDLKRLEGICRSPVFSHLTATINGLATIRARNIQNKLVNEFDGLQNVHSAVWQLAATANTAFGLWMDCVSTAFLASVTFSFIILFADTFSGNVGLAISQALILTGMVQYGIRQATETVQQMTGVERILQYTDLEPEQSPSETPPEDWPRTGKIKFLNMSLRYDPNGVPTLKNLRLEIPTGYKVGVVGRTGAGKSSLIGALFRLANVDGIIEIDDINTGTIALSNLREKISIIPQDPVLFSNTVRYNLDPFGNYTDDDMWRSLEAVELKSMIENLDFFVTEGGTNFSQGQRQLICLARAILRNNKVLVLDEATANVDPQTDALIQNTIREKFKDFTVITVAHRLHTIMDSDRVLVMDAGSAKEYDIPHNLLQIENGIFRGMVDATGPQECEQLKKVAAHKFTELI